jgi:hypothetical protein
MKDISLSTIVGVGTGLIVATSKALYNLNPYYYTAKGAVEKYTGPFFGDVSFEEGGALLDAGLTGLVIGLGVYALGNIIGDCYKEKEPKTEEDFDKEKKRWYEHFDVLKKAKYAESLSEEKLREAAGVLDQVLDNFKEEYNQRFFYKSDIFHMREDLRDIFAEVEIKSNG